MADNQNVVAVYGSLRSGTTLLRLMLNQNSHLTCPGESDFVFDHLHDDDAALPSHDLTALEGDRIFRGNLPDYAEWLAPDLSLAQLFDRLAGTGGSAPQTLVLMLHRNLDKLLRRCPDMKIIHLVRDPRDVARSSVQMGWAASTHYGVRHWLHTEGDWSRRRRDMHSDNVLTFRYEDLVQQPEAILTQMCDFLGVPFEPAMLEFDQVSSYAKTDASLAYQWKHKQSARDVGLVEVQVGPLLDELGYEKSDHPEIQPGALERLGLAVQQKTFVWSHKIRRFGLRDTLLVALSRWLRLPRLGRLAQLRIDEVNRQRLK